MEWQPIETWDGEGVVLIYQPEHRSKSGRMTLRARIVTSDNAGFVRASTHWMPLPDPPTE